MVIQWVGHQSKYCICNVLRQTNQWIDPLTCCMSTYGWMRKCTSVETSCETVHKATCDKKKKNTQHTKHYTKASVYIKSLWDLIRYCLTVVVFCFSLSLQEVGCCVHLCESHGHGRSNDKQSLVTMMSRAPLQIVWFKSCHVLRRNLTNFVKRLQQILNYWCRLVEFGIKYNTFWCFFPC